MNERDQVLESVGKTQRAVDRMDAALARQIIKAYGDARVALIGELESAFARLGDDPTAAQVRGLMSQRSLILAIERRIDTLMSIINETIQETVSGVTSRTWLGISAEIEILAAAVGVEQVAGLSVDALLELTIAPAVEQVAGLSAATKATITSALRSQLAQGARLDEITRVVFGKGKDTGIFQRGLVSARRMAHRAISEAENTARTAYLENAAQQIDGLQRQAVAKIDSKTSKTCLRAHGQIVGVDKPFELVGDMRLAPRVQVPPFHWGPCRTTVTGYLARFEQNSSLTTAQMRREAQELLAG